MVNVQFFINVLLSHIQFSVLLIAVRGATTAGEKRGEAGELFLPSLGLAPGPSLLLLRLLRRGLEDLRHDIWVRGQLGLPRVTRHDL